MAAAAAPDETSTKMTERTWWSLSPSSRWLSAKNTSDDETNAASKAVWALPRARDPLCGRALPYWAEAAAVDAPQRCGNPDALLTEHWRINGRAVRTRFPPEPNGYLHIGHAKSMNQNFNLAFAKLEAALAGQADDKTVVDLRRETVFRYDDTNPEKESAEFIGSLRKDVAWLGWSPVQVTHTSEYFDTLYAMAIELIEAGKAYACDQTSSEIEACRKVAKARAALRALPTTDASAPPEALLKEAQLENPTAHQSPYRDRSVAENLKLFEDMRRGCCAEGSRTLRLKMDTEAANFNMFDQVAYRVKFAPHPHIGDGWCIYPTYDYTHCVIDSLEHVDYSICTLEFETRRESYYWVLDALDIYRPKVFEMSRLNITYTVLSKRKLTKLVTSGRVRGWDDPRMPTVSGLRRRGYSPEAINAFCDDVGVTRNENWIDYERLQHFARVDLETTARRRMAVKRPLLVEIENLGDVVSTTVVTSPEFPHLGAESPTYDLTLTSSIYVDRADFREVDDPDFFGLAPNKLVRLRHAGIYIRCDGVEKNGSDQVMKLTCRAFGAPPDGAKEPKGKLHWVSDADAVPCELRDYDHLFTVPKVDDELWESQLADASEVVYTEALAHASVRAALQDTNAPVQFERHGFYCVDQDSSAERLVLNRTVDLRSAYSEASSASGTAAASGTKRDRSRKDEQAAQAARKAAAMAVPADRMFRELPEYAGLFSAFDDDGVPTHGADGEALTKSAIKKLKKDQAKHKKMLDKDHSASGPKHAAATK
mmetsp:Transcript_5854/g.24460  ORF Transcript_5854/g.24460 Transcript_5854/m.24460 type:complete len:767 (-) Transcript_5854:1039-3339(-)